MYILMRSPQWLENCNRIVKASPIWYRIRVHTVRGSTKGGAKSEKKLYGRQKKKKSRSIWLIRQKKRGNDARDEKFFWHNLLANATISLCSPSISIPRSDPRINFRLARPPPLIARKLIAKFKPPAYLFSETRTWFVVGTTRRFSRLDRSWAGYK